MSNIVLTAKVAGIAAAFSAAGGIATLSLFDVPLLQPQPASRSLPQVRWLFSRGSHIFPSLSVFSAASFAYTAYAALPKNASSISDVFKVLTAGGKSSAYLAAALLCASIGPWTTQIMLPTNFKLIDLNVKKGGYMSSNSAQVAQEKSTPARDTVNGPRNTSEFTDLSVPQTKTEQSSTPAEDREVNDLLTKFGQLNAVRAVLIAAGGAVALLAALTP